MAYLILYNFLITRISSILLFSRKTVCERPRGGFPRQKCGGTLETRLKKSTTFTLKPKRFHVSGETSEESRPLIRLCSSPGEQQEGCVTWFSYMEPSTSHTLHDETFVLSSAGDANASTRYVWIGSVNVPSPWRGPGPGRLCLA